MFTVATEPAGLVNMVAWITSSLSQYTEPWSRNSLLQWLTLAQSTQPLSPKKEQLQLQHIPLVSKLSTKLTNSQPKNKWAAAEVTDCCKGTNQIAQSTQPLNQRTES